MSTSESAIRTPLHAVEATLASWPEFHPRLRKERWNLRPLRQPNPLQ
jgi:hypothetical protein